MAEDSSGKNNSDIVTLNDKERASAEDFEIPRCVDTVEQAMTIIRAHYEETRHKQTGNRWNSAPGRNHP